MKKLLLLCLLTISLHAMQELQEIRPQIDTAAPEKTALDLMHEHPELFIAVEPLYRKKCTLAEKMVLSPTGGTLATIEQGGRIQHAFRKIFSRGLANLLLCNTDLVLRRVGPQSLEKFTTIEYASDVAFNGKGNMAATNEHYLLKIIETATGECLLKTDIPAQGIRFTNDGQHVLAYDPNNQDTTTPQNAIIRFVDPRSGEVLRIFSTHDSMPFSRIIESPAIEGQANHLFYKSNTECFAIKPADPTRIACLDTTVAPEKHYYTVRFSQLTSINPEGARSNRCFSYRFHKEACIHRYRYDSWGTPMYYNDGRAIRDIKKEQQKPTHITFNHDGSLCAIGTTHTLLIVDTKTGKAVLDLYDCEGSKAVFSPDGKKIIFQAKLALQYDPEFVIYELLRAPAALPEDCLLTPADVITAREALSAAALNGTAQCQVVYPRKFKSQLARMEIMRALLEKIYGKRPTPPSLLNRITRMCTYGKRPQGYCQVPTDEEPSEAKKNN